MSPYYFDMTKSGTQAYLQMEERHRLGCPRIGVTEYG